MQSLLHKSLLLKCTICFVAIAVTLPLFAHPINLSMERAPTQDVIWYYFKMGITHIIPLGTDHILFVAGLCLISNNIKAILWQATAFTVAHSITLALSVKGIVVAPSPLVEPVIALSIIFVAVENLLLKEIKPWRILVVFVFGLIHGLGFASALNEVGLPRNNFLPSVLAFNLGVEAGQATVILLVFALIVIPLGKKLQYKKLVVNPLSVIIALIAGYWTIERLFL